jgi:ferredoxin/flavodoxin
MKAAICYYSATGNTRLAAQFVAKRLSLDAELFDVRDAAPDLSKYDLVAFASPTDWLEEPQQMRAFMGALPRLEGKPSLVIVTHGGMPGRTPANLAKAATSKGLKIIGCVVVRAPDNYPPIVAAGRPKDLLVPTDEELADLGKQLGELKARMEAAASGKEVGPAIVKPSLIFSMLPHISRSRSKKQQGPKSVDEKLCTKCGKCARSCPYSAIALNPLPTFDEAKCWGCWACFNLCPAKAIYTRKLRGKGQYPGPTGRYKEKYGA